MSKKRVVLIGANGQLGTDMMKIFTKDKYFTLIPLTHKDIEISDVNSIKKVFDAINPHIIINTASYNRVDEAESNAQKAFLINGLANKYIGEYFQGKDIVFTYISTDYVFGIDKKREKPYKESDCPGPINAYGISKLAGEYFTAYMFPKYFIVRSSGLFGTTGSKGKGGNFVELMLRLAKEKNHLSVVDDQIVSPTYTLDLAKQIIKLIKTGAFGLYHATSQGQCSWYSFAKEIFSLTNTNVKLESIPSAKFPTQAKRAHFSVLENENLKKLGIDIMRDWQEGLRDYLKEKGYM